jgi:murein DD-endopeptidase MepM/ murein hydrolase activator NlpD
MTEYIYSAVAGLFMAATILLLQPGAPAQQIVIEEREQASLSPANDREAAAVALLTALGNAQPSAGIVAEVVAWSIAEDGGSDAMSRNNPWNTTKCGFNMIGSINSDGGCGVGHYATFEDGIAANAATLEQGNFSEARAALLANDPEGFKQALWRSEWAASRYGGGANWPVYQLEETHGGSAPVSLQKCGFTDTMAIGEGSSFYSTGSGYWSGQYGGMHLGDDFVGNPGDPVYAPWDMTIDSVGEYTDPGRFGKNIQAHIVSDGYLFYAGHLIDVYVSAGQLVPACTQIGTLGATAGPHTHIKMAGSQAPIPCEGSEPGPNGCIDPMEYWQEH